MENKFKYRPEIKSIEDLQPGDEFLVGDERWDVRTHVCEDGSGELFMIHNNGMLNYNLHRDFIRANVPIERDIPYPEGGAEKWELRDGDDEWRLPNPHRFWTGDDWVPGHCLGERSKIGCIYAIPKAKPQDEPAPKEYTVVRVSSATGGSLAELHYDGHGNPLKPGDRVTVQRVSEQGEGT
jgi:hypothetical protein